MVGLWREHGAPYQQWRLEGQHLVSNLGGDLVLDIKGSCDEPGAPVIVWPKHSARNQMWKLDYDAD